MALTYQESFALMSDLDFGGRVQVACLKYADSIMNEASSVPAHNTRKRWADRVYQQPNQVAREVQPATVMDPAVQDAGVDENGKSLITDTALQASVEVTVNKML